MSYSDGEAKILAIIRLHADYSAGNSNRGNWLILNSGKDSHYVILRMGQAANGPNTISGALTVWQTDVMAYQRYAENGTSAIELQGHVQTLIEHLEKYPTLQGTVTDAQITTVGAMQEAQMIDGGPRWLLSVISLQWQEERDITYI